MREIGVDLLGVLSHVVMPPRDGCGGELGNACGCPHAIFLDEGAAELFHFGFWQAFAVERRAAGFDEIFVAVEAFVHLRSGAVVSSADYVFAFRFLVVAAGVVLANGVDTCSWARHFITCTKNEQPIYKAMLSQTTPNIIYAKTDN